MITRFRIAILAAAAVLLGGCATPRQAEVHHGMDASEARAKVVQQAIGKEPEPYFVQRDELWLGSTSKPVSAVQQEDPPELRLPIAYRHMDIPVTLQQIAEFISTEAHVPAHVTADAATAAGEIAPDQRDAFAQAAIAQQNARGAAGGGTASQTQAGFFRLQYEGTLRGFLDQVAARTGNSWRYREGRVEIYHLDTRVFRIQTFAGNTTVKSNITNTAGSAGAGGGGGGSSGGGSGSAGGSQTSANSDQTTQIENQIEVMKAMKTSVESMLTAKGKVTVLETAGQLVVTDIPYVLDRVGTYVDTLNAQLNEQVAIDVHVYSLELTDADSIGIDWQAVYKTLNGRYQIASNSVGDQSTDSNFLNVSVIDNAFRWAGTQIFLNALSTQGKLVTETSSANITVSNRPIPVQVTGETGYVPSVQTTVVPLGGGTQTSFTTGSRTTGFAMQLLPVVLENRQILLQVQMSLSAVSQIRNVAIGGNTAQIPEVNNRQFAQAVRIPSGNTLVLTGFEANALRGDDRGVGRPDFVLAGGSRGTGHNRTMLVVVITPRIIG